MTRAPEISDSALGQLLQSEARGFGFDDVGLVRADCETPLAKPMRDAVEEQRLGPLDWLV